MTGNGIATTAPIHAVLRGSLGTTAARYIRSVERGITVRRSGRSARGSEKHRPIIRDRQQYDAAAVDESKHARRKRLTPGGHPHRQQDGEAPQVKQRPGLGRQPVIEAHGIPGEADDPEGDEVAGRYEKNEAVKTGDPLLKKIAALLGAPRRARRVPLSGRRRFNRQARSVGVRFPGSLNDINWPVDGRSPADTRLNESVGLKAAQRGRCLIAHRQPIAARTVPPAPVPAAPANVAPSDQPLSRYSSGTSSWGTCGSGRRPGRRRGVLDAADDAGLERLTFFDQLLDALRIRARGSRQSFGVAGLTARIRAQPPRRRPGSHGGAGGPPRALPLRCAGRLRGRRLPGRHLLRPGGRRTGDRFAPGGALRRPRCLLRPCGRLLSGRLPGRRVPASPAGRARLRLTSHGTLLRAGRRLPGSRLFLDHSRTLHRAGRPLCGPTLRCAGGTRGDRA